MSSSATLSRRPEHLPRQQIHRKTLHAYSAFVMASPTPNRVSTVPVARKPHEV